jgi:hypothetical protein
VNTLTYGVLGCAITDVTFAYAKPKEPFVEHRTINQLELAGHVSLALPLSRAERLYRWATALEQLGSMPLNTLWRTEFAFERVRQSMRADNSPLTVAFNDPVLRTAGLKDDSYCEALRFFEVTDRQLHWLVCFCHHGRSILAADAARGVRSMMDGHRSWFARVFG